MFVGDAMKVVGLCIGAMAGHSKDELTALRLWQADVAVASCSASMGLCYAIPEVHLTVEFSSLAMNTPSTVGFI